MSKLKVYLIIDGKNYGMLNAVESLAYDVEEYYAGHINGHPMILSTWDKPTAYSIKMPGAEIECKKFKQTTTKEKHVYHLILDTDDINLMKLFPFENKKLYVDLFELSQTAKIPYSVYNDSVDMETLSKNITSEQGTETEEQDRLLELLPALKDAAKCPACDEEEHEGDLWEVIIYLNDEHQWTRESIADWLETLDSDITFPIGE